MNHDLLQSLLGIILSFPADNQRSLTLQQEWFSNMKAFLMDCVNNYRDDISVDDHNGNHV